MGSAQATRDSNAVLAKAARTTLWLSMAAALAVYLFSGIYVVKPEQQALVARFGKLVSLKAGQGRPRIILPGTHYHLPYPVDKVYYLKPNEVKSVVIAADTLYGEGEIEGEIPEDEPEGEAYEQQPRAGAEFLTGDENIIHIALSAQYRVSAPTRYVFCCADPERLVRDATEMAMADTVARTPVDDLLTSGKQLVLARVKEISQQKLEALEAGINIISVNFASVSPPAEVSDAFKDVASALEDRDRIINEAEGDQNEAIHRARGNAQQDISTAVADRDAKINRAKGETERFLSVLREYRQSGESEVSLTRLYIESIEEVLSTVRKYLIDPPNKP